MGLESDKKAQGKDDLRRRLNITSWDNTFENFKPLKGSTESLRVFKQLASGKATWHMLMVYGLTGCGKSHLCEALSIALATRKIYCAVTEWSEQVRLFKRWMRSEITDQYDVRFEQFRKSTWLILDDVGMGTKGTEWEWSELEDIVNYRYRNDLHTVVTTNLDLKLVPDRIVSRFRDAEKSRLVLNESGDYRPRKGVK